MTNPDLAVVGAGQLARMMQPPAIELGIRLRLLAEAADASAAQVIVDSEVGDYTNFDDLRRIVGSAPVVTFDHEHVPPEHLTALQAAGIECRPGPHALIFAQDKGDMRAELDKHGLPSPAFAVTGSDDVAAATADLQQFVDQHGLPVIAKTSRGGYDGKGVWKLDSVADFEAVVQPVHGSGIDILFEQFVPFARELSAQVCRRPSGEIVAYPVVESWQKDGVCAEVIAPAPDLPVELSSQAQKIAATVATALDVVGMLAVELFETTDGQLLVNEFAMRPHNSGHWSIDGAVTSQFENHLRAVLDLPLGGTEPIAPWTVMVNLLGGSVTDLPAQRAAALSVEPDVSIHLYGKAVKPGRKVGHVTATGSDLDDVLRRARRSAKILTEGIDL